MEYEFFRQSYLPRYFQGGWAVSEKGELYLPWFMVTFNTTPKAVSLLAAYDAVEPIICPLGDAFYPWQWVAANTQHNKQQFQDYIKVAKARQDEPEAAFKVKLNQITN